MAEVRIDDHRVHVDLTPIQQLGAVCRPFSVARSSITGVDVVDAPFERLRGWRVPGTGWPRVIALGTWRGRGTKDFVSIHRNERAVLIDLEGERFDRLLVGVEAPEVLAAQLA